ncbi:MAG: hypothetical protein DME99_13225 [Verrucomicrobia bacterium]|nr:MAG: hypothetical protein DME99_13225 [Verrucomicrobiota bacterium]
MHDRTGRNPSGKQSRAEGTIGRQELSKQVLRSSTSVGANYREAYRARNKAEFIAKCGDSLRELEERSVPNCRDIDGQTRAGSG